MLELLLGGKSPAEIAEAMHLSHHTISHHLDRLRLIHGGRTVLEMTTIILTARCADLADQVATLVAENAALQTENAALHAALLAMNARRGDRPR